MFGRPHLAAQGGAAAGALRGGVAAARAAAPVPQRRRGPRIPTSNSCSTSTSTSSPRRRGSRLQYARRHLCRLRRLSDRARRADADRPRREEGERLGVQGKPPDHIDYGAGQASYAGKSEALAPGTIRETPDGWCVQTSALARWFGIGVKPMTAGLGADAPVGRQAAGRAGDGAGQSAPRISSRASFDLAGLPQVRVPYRCGARPRSISSSAPASPIAPATACAIDRQSFGLSPPARSRGCPMTRSCRPRPKGVPNMLRVRAYRSDPDGASARAAASDPFRRRRCRGVRQQPDRRRLPPGAARSSPTARWRPAQRSTAPASKATCRAAGRRKSTATASFSALPSRTADQRYVFEDVQLLYGENQVRIVLYGPQGQIRTREEHINVGQDNVPKGKTWYWAGANQPGRDIFTLRKAARQRHWCPGRRPRSRSSTASTIERRWACSRARC